MTATRYSLIQRVLHWAIALLVLMALLGGSVLWAYGFEGLRDTFGMATTNMIYTAHKTIGVTILGLMVLRVIARAGLGAPAPVSTLTPIERRLSTAVHGLLYVAIIAMASLGWLATGAGGFPVNFFQAELPGILSKDAELSQTLFVLHGLVGLSVAGLAALHIAGAVRHWKVKRDGVMERMSLI